MIEEIRFAADSPLEKAGSEPSVLLKAPGDIVASVLVRADFPAGGESAEAT